MNFIKKLAVAAALTCTLAVGAVITAPGVVVEESEASRRCGACTAPGGGDGYPTRIGCLSC